MYHVLARKLRPQSFEQVVGQEPVVRALRNAVAAGRVAHAYVFAGVRGVGKTTTARILAKCLNCERGPAPEPCNVCLPCREITEGRALDVLELDAASRTGVDDIRELQQVVSYAPARDRYKVLIIDEAHMLSKSAFNALLKTLEEPPPQVVFVLATTEPHRIPATILSRCQVFDFRRVAPRRIREHLQEVCAREGLVLPARVLDWIARASEGSLRDALSVLERVVAFCGETVSEEDARTILGTVRSEALARMVAGMAQRDAPAMLRELDALVGEGVDLVQLWSELLATVRDLLVDRAVPHRPELIGRADDEWDALQAAGQALSRQDLLRIFQILADLEYPLKSSSQPRYLFEATLIRIAELGVLQPIESLLSAIQPRNPPGTPAQTSPRKTEKKSPPLADAGPPSARAASRSADPDTGLRERLRAAVAAARPALAAVVETVRDLRLEGECLVIGLGPDQAALEALLQDRENARALRQEAAAIAGGPVTLEIRHHGRASEARGTSGEPGPEAPPRKQRPPASPGPAAGELLERATREPGVRRLLAEFGAEVVEIQPLGVDPLLPEAGEGEENE